MLSILTRLLDFLPNLHLRRGRRATFREILDTGRERAGHTRYRWIPSSATRPIRLRSAPPGAASAAAGGAHPPPQPRRLRRPVAPARARARRCAPRSSRAGPTRWSSTGRRGPGRRRSRGSSPESSGAAFEELSAVAAGRPEVRAVIERAATGATTGGPPDGPVPRRDPPLQQGPAGRAAAGGGGRARDADRRDHREPGVRGQRRPALAAARVRAAARSPPRRSSWCSRARPPATSAPAVDEDALRFLAAAQRRRRPHGPERARAGRRDRGRERRARRSRSRASRTPCSGARSSTTNRATATTTTPPPGSRRPAARTRTPRSTTSP